MISGVSIDRDAVAFTNSSVSFFAMYVMSNFASSWTGEFAAGVCSLSCEVLSSSDPEFSLSLDAVSEVVSCKAPEGFDGST